MKEIVIHPFFKKPLLVPVVLTTAQFLISLFLGNLVEKVVAKQLQHFLEDSSFLNSFQSSFCPGHWMETVLVTLTNDLCRHLEEGGLVLLLLLDLSIAFNTGL